ncbi:MAG: oligosaccharide flippase family protein [Acidaminococcus sp.]|uniref:putative polysaccharide biosynthesis protein n=1 Tax=Acidaminococcus sp. TaxID=1872103 RepID=UPI003F170E4A
MEQQEQTPANSKTKKFLKGTMILTISSIVVKVIGALNWVILSRVMGGEGIGLYQMGFPIYLMAITVSSAGIPVAISIVTAEKVAKKDYGGAQHVFKVSLWMMLATGMLFTGALLALARFLVDSGFIPDPRAYYSIIALAPAVFFVTFLSSFRGYFQGWQIMTPTACSEITEQLIRVVTMIAFSYLLLPYGLTYAAAGASMGAGAGAFCGLLVLLGFYRKLKHKFFPQGEETVPPQNPEPAGQIIKRLIMLALPVSMASLMLPIVSNLDMVIVPRRLMAGGWSMSEATTLFGYLTGMAVPLVNMSTILTAALSISLVPAISESRTLEDTEGIREKVAAAFSVAAVITIPCSIGLHVLGGRVAALIYNAPKAGPAIETMSWAIFLLGLHQVSTGILQGLGKTKIPVINMIIAAASKVFLNWNLTPTMGIVGSSWATVADIGVAAILNLFFIKKYTGFSLELKQLLKTAVAAVAMGAAVKGFLALVPNWGAWSILGGMAVAIPVYALLLLVLKTMPEEELAQIPFVGRRMVLLGHQLKLL